MTRIHTLEDDITFERVRRLPKRTNVYSVHRKLSWQCQKEIKLFEKENKVNTFELKRSQTSMRERLTNLINIKKQIFAKRFGPSTTITRRKSCPSVFVSGSFPSELQRQKTLSSLQIDGHKIGLDTKCVQNRETKTSVKFKVDEKKADESKHDQSIGKREKGDAIQYAKEAGVPIPDKPFATFFRRRTLPAVLQVEQVISLKEKQ
ncbi:hypothetical protein ACJMK2_041991 [Sinanodonta woodiana]|uniref:Uncharacterized protein n=1 Tax=Sinanodonta woodiana TaxID=1069815 RepID=A0ABD3W7B4_SINWO